MCHLKPSLEQMVKTCLINFTSALTSSEDHGRRHIAPLIGVDGIFLKCTLKGQLLAAIGRDACTKMY